MTNRQTRQSVSLLVRVGLPLCAAAALTAVLIPVFPSDELAAWALYPAVFAGISWAAQLWYVAQSLTITASNGSF